MRTSGRADRRALGGLAAIAGALAFAAWLASGGAAGLRERLESPETGIRRALASAPGDASAGDGLRLERLRFTDLLVEADGGRAEVVAVAEADGVVAWRDRPV
ncbi:MAG TPA: hypothetical protein VLT61_03165, partial [Anaeromyxobacteraceae bacterium]|nr:hypothetical protein [Anaeromyxobacteraceae bacterium]